MGSLLRSLLVLTLVACIVSSNAARPKNVIRYGGEEVPTPPSNPISTADRVKGFFDKFKFRFNFGKLKPGDVEIQIPPQRDYDESDGTTNFLGSWKIHSENAGVSAMHMQVMPNGKAIMYDSTSNGLSEIDLVPRWCAPRVGGRPTDPQQDCTAHGVEYDVDTAQTRTLKMETSPWCSSGALNKNGELVSTGGFQSGFQSVRVLKPCPTCEFEEDSRALYSNRWYATQHALENGSFIVIGGRNAYNYELIPADPTAPGGFTPQLFELPLLEDTEDDGGREDNLYPFVNLLPDGNLFVFANYKSIVLNPYTAQTVRQLPDLPGGSRSYPPSGMSALLPINLDVDDQNLVGVEVIVCGGNTRDSYTYSDLQLPNRTFLEAARDCGRLNLNVEGGLWDMEDMPTPRVMGDMLLLPNGEILIINGAKAGTSAWNAAADPNLTPVLYSPYKPKGERFKELAPSAIPRMYHSVSAVLPSGEILVAGSNTNGYYKLEKYGDDFTFPTELRVEKFTPPYLVPNELEFRFEIVELVSEKKLKYGVEFGVGIDSKGVEIAEGDDFKVTMYSPPFTTHGYSHNQRLLILKLVKVEGGRVTVVAPPSSTLAPPGYYMLFVVYGGVPSKGIWVHIE